jgi:chorismate mutase/prephenate dehydratase
MIKVSYLGIPGSYSYIAGRKYFGKKVGMRQNNSIADIFAGIVAGKASFGIVPVENSTTGSIMETYDLLAKSNLTIVGEVILKIKHYFLVNKHFIRAKYCFAPSQAALQCRRFLDKHPEIELIFTSDTATAAKTVSERKRRNEAAIAGKETAKIYGLKIIPENINTDKTNSTRFAVIAKKQKSDGGKISLAFFLRHTPGSLFSALKPFKDAGLNLTKIESRPIPKKPWEYVFFIDFEADIKGEKIKEVIRQMEKRVRSLIILGRYNKGKVYEA